MKQRTTNQVTAESSLFRVIFLALFFLLGVVFGQVLAHHIPKSAAEELACYLQDYLRLGSAGAVTPEVLCSTVFIYFRYPMLAFLLGFASIGFLLLPFVTLGFGLFLSFSVNCFTASLGVKGILLSLIVFGFRCLMTLPCYFLLAIPAWSASMDLAVLSRGKERRRGTVGYHQTDWIRLGVCIAALTFGMVLDLFLSPSLLRLLLHRFFL